MIDQSGIYIIHNNISNKFYVGSAVDIDRRWYTHRFALNKKNHKNSYLQNAWNKYGEGAFELLTLERCEIEKLIEYEQFYIDRWWNTGKLYNLSPTAGSQLGAKRSDEARRKMSEARRNISDETRRKMSKAKSNMSDETRRKISETLKGNIPWNKGIKTGVTSWNKGVPRTEEEKLRVSKSLKRYYQNKRLQEAMPLLEDGE